MNTVGKVVVTVVIGAAMFMSLSSWIMQMPCPLLRPIGEFVHQWWSAIPINALGALVLWRLWRRTKIVV